MSGFEVIDYRKRDDIGHITLNRPGVMNVYNLQMRDELYEVLGAVEADPEVRAVIVSGAGDKAFCAGADLTEFLTAPSPLVARKVRWQRDVWGRFLGIEKPFIAALHGFVFGSGVEIALCCDIRLAAEDAWFALPEAGLGIIPAAGATQTLPRAMGKAGALEMLLTGERVSARQALKWGLVNRVVGRGELMSTAEGLARRIGAHSPAAVSYIKRAVTGGLDLDIEGGLELEARLGRQLVASSCGPEGG